jgi:lysophospholipase L1-like esterase
MQIKWWLTFSILVCFTSSLWADASLHETTIYPIGDSITQGVDGLGYRKPLYDLLKQHGIKPHFVGSLSNGGEFFPEPRHDGPFGWTVGQISAEIDGWLNQYNPDFVLIMLGSNDIEQGQNLLRSLDQFVKIVGNIHRRRPAAKILISEVSLIVDAKFDRQAIWFNKKLKARLAKTNLKSKLVFVPMHDVLEPKEILDLDHPTPAGNKKVAQRWFKYLSI